MEPYLPKPSPSMSSYTSNAIAGPSSDRLSFSFSAGANGSGSGSGGKHSRRGSFVGGGGKNVGLDDPFAGSGGLSAPSSGSKGFNSSLLRSPQSPSKKRSYGDRCVRDPSEKESVS